jgi:nucleotide-binding universal stress UspA family protein
MILFQSILVPLDGSRFAEHALPLAAIIARTTGATLRLLRVESDTTIPWNEPTPGASESKPGPEDSHPAAQAYLEGAAERVRAAFGIPVQQEFAHQQGTISAAIRGDVASRKVDLVVLTSHGRGAVSRLWLGSVADELVRSLEVPLLLVRPGENEAVNLDVAPGIGKILVALDGRTSADGILNPALMLGLAMKAEFVLMHVVPPPITSEYTALTSSPDCSALAPSIEIVETAERQQASAREYLEKVARRIRDQGSRVQIQLRAGEQPAAAILAEAEKDIDLIALETHGRSGLSRLILGSVADKVIRGSTHPVLVCRDREGGAGSS